MSICLYVCMPACMSIHLAVCLSLCPSYRLNVYLFKCLSVYPSRIVITSFLLKFGYNIALIYRNINLDYFISWTNDSSFFIYSDITRLPSSIPQCIFYNITFSIRVDGISITVQNSAYHCINSQPNWKSHIKFTSEQVLFFVQYLNINIFGVISEKLIFDHLYTYFKGP